MLYILECMARAIMATIMGYDGELITTGEKVTNKDVGVALLGWLVTILIVLIIVFLIKYLSQLNKINISKDNFANYQESNIKEQDLKKNKIVINPFMYVIECMALCVLCMHGGINRPMITTKQRPNSKDIVVAIVGWLYIGLVIIGIVLVCNVS